ncbi:hypothetical protein, partial [Mycoplasma phocimorsus]|uniref:hypothetical protein n=1 Tax=Mycoplasma phocimorsus TaxID=3045839 RepID=UPI0024C0B401
AFGNEKYQLQKLIVEAINNFDNKLMQDIMFDTQFASGSSVSNETKASTMRTSNSISIKNFEYPSVWKLLWIEVKSWWNNWMGTVFYGLVGASATIGIGYSAYTAYWNNKRNFNLKQNENLKITLEIKPKNNNHSDNWYANFYNNNSILDTDCSCQRKFKNKSGNNNYSVSYILRNGPINPKLILYNYKDSNSETDWFPIIDYYPGSNIVSFYKFGGKKEKLGDLVIRREIISDEQLCEICTKQEHFITCECTSSKCKNNNRVNECHIAIEKKKCNICTNNENGQEECKCKFLCCTINKEGKTCCINIENNECNMHTNQEKCKCKTLCCAINKSDKKCCVVIE